MKNNLEFSEEQIKKLNKRSLADKWLVTSQYVGQVLRQEKGLDQTAHNIRKDARAMLDILEDPILSIEVIEPEFVTG